VPFQRAPQPSLRALGRDQVATVQLMVEYVAGVLTRDRLAELLPAKGVRSTAYSLFGAHAADAFVIDQRANRWVVFYSERGAESDLVAHDSEDAACRDLLDRLYKYEGHRDL
jgi:hypothetical protein